MDTEGATTSSVLPPTYLEGQPHGRYLRRHEFILNFAINLILGRMTESALRNCYEIITRRIPLPAMWCAPDFFTRAARLSLPEADPIIVGTASSHASD
jgi:hypothetical protein